MGFRHMCISCGTNNNDVTNFINNIGRLCNDCYNKFVFKKDILADLSACKNELEAILLKYNCELYSDDPHEPVMLGTLEGESLIFN